MKTTTLSTFTRQYPISKTLRFSLLPVGKTREHIRANGFLENDEIRAEKYRLVKAVIDEYHKAFIEQVLGGLRLDGIEEYFELYRKRDATDAEKKKLEEVQKRLREQIADAFRKHPWWTTLEPEPLFKKALPSFVKDDENLSLVKYFQKFTTYFRGFYENRNNIYSAEAKATAIAYRVVHENLPRFLDNCTTYMQARSKPELANTFTAIERELYDDLRGTRLEEVFEPTFFQKTFTQSGIDFYNTVIGGRTLGKGRKIRGVNEFVNTEHNQKQTDKKNRISRFLPLHKQVLSDRDTASFVLAVFTKDDEILDAVRSYYRRLAEPSTDQKLSVLSQLTAVLADLSHADLTRVYVRRSSLNDLSRNICGDWGLIERALDDWYERKKIDTGVKRTKSDATKEKWLKEEYVAIAIIDEALKEFEVDSNSVYRDNIATYFAELLDHHDAKETVTEMFERTYRELEIVLAKRTSKTLVSDTKTVEAIKSFLDAALAVYRFARPLMLDPSFIGERDTAFMSTFMPIYEELDIVVPLYNKTRNYLTKKPYSLEKLKLNFENATLLDGWDLNKETDNTSIIFRRGRLYYLGIMHRKHNRTFRSIPEPKQGEVTYEKMVYKLIPGPNKMFPKVFFSAKGKKIYHPPKDLLERYKQGTHKKGNTFSKEDCHALIDFFKKGIERHEEWKNFGFVFSATEKYDDVSGFYREVEAQAYKISWQNVSASWIDSLVEEGKLFLFVINSKDFSSHSRGTPNLHTLYWRALFDLENLEEGVYKLNGGAEVFYRKPSLDLATTTVHPANQSIANKNPLAERRTSTFPYAITKDRRFTQESFQFHVPITLNFTSYGRPNLNTKVREFLKGNTSVNIIGIDRGERNPLYISVIDQKGNILVQESLNTIVNTYRDKVGATHQKRTDYHNLLGRKETERDEARTSWSRIENIKELKEGYLSHVIHRITTLMVEYNAIIVMENLNVGFKRGRYKVEKQVYQKFEKMLIDKLNYLVFKNREPHVPGGILRAFQLTSKFSSFRDMGIQSGFLFYVPPAYTSTMDPVTGFVDLLKPRYTNLESARNFIRKCKDIRYDLENHWFVFDIDYAAFTAKTEVTTRWIVCTTNCPRYVYERAETEKHGRTREINATQELETLFTQAGINYIDGQDLRDAITKQTNKSFFRKLLWVLGIVMKLRYSNGLKGTDELDYIASPVKPFFCSLNDEVGRPADADANGAYHIAKKGLLILKRIDEAEEPHKANLAISNKDWFAFAQGK
jgi:CRISPR-associated protein Cpf1